MDCAAALVGVGYGFEAFVETQADWEHPAPAVSWSLRREGLLGRGRRAWRRPTTRPRLSTKRRQTPARPVSFPILWDQDSVRLTRLGVTFMPVTLIVDRRGTIRYVHQGWDDALDVWGVHGMGGVIGTLCMGFFANKAINPAIPNGLFYGGDASLLLKEGVAILMAISAGLVDWIIRKVG